MITNPPTNPMKCLSLLQIWATLLAYGEKEFETRDWYTPYRGWLAIHASKGIKDLEAFLEVISSKKYLSHPTPWVRHGGIFVETLSNGNPRDLFPLGAVIGMAKLVEVRRVETIRDQITTPERAFGNYDDGRWAWRFKDACLFPEPIPAKGALGIWMWDPNAQPEAPRERAPREPKAVKVSPVVPSFQQRKLF